MNRHKHGGEEVIVIGTAAAFSGEADFFGELFKDIERERAHDDHVFNQVLLTSEGELFLGLYKYYINANHL